MLAGSSRSKSELPMMTAGTVPRFTTEWTMPRVSTKLSPASKRQAQRAFISARRTRCEPLRPGSPQEGGTKPGGRIHGCRCRTLGRDPETSPPPQPAETTPSCQRPQAGERPDSHPLECPLHHVLGSDRWGRPPTLLDSSRLLATAVANLVVQHGGT